MNSSVLLHKSFSKQKKSRLEKTNFELTVTEILKPVKLQYLKIQIPVKTKVRLFLQTFRLTLILIWKSKDLHEVTIVSVSQTYEHKQPLPNNEQGSLMLA